MEFDDILKKRMVELEQLLRKIIEDSDKFTEIRDVLEKNGYNAVLCLMTLVFRQGESFLYDEDFFEEEIDEKLETEFFESLCESDKSFLKGIQDHLDY
ncbi:hypothetical protein KDK77_05425 [bacterium]|nr:hypothetical protein [bacterium]MCP5462575.1 hypothetical protein [bacterium]